MHLFGMDTDQIAQLGLEQLLTVEDLAAYLDVPRQTIYDWRVHGRGPRARRIGKRLRFTAVDVKAWVDAQAEPPGTAGPPGPGR